MAGNVIRGNNPPPWMTGKIISAGVPTPSQEALAPPDLTPFDVLPSVTSLPGLARRAVTEGSQKGVRWLQRIEQKGVPPGTPAKTHGLYTTPLEYESPHKDLGGFHSIWALSPQANVLKPPLYSGKDVAIRKGAINAGGGVHAAKHLLGDETFESLRKGTKAEAVRYAETHFPGPDYTKYYDKQEVIEAIGAQAARKQGYDAIDLPITTMPEFSEVILLNPKTAERVR